MNGIMQNNPQIGVGGVNITDKHKQYVMQVLDSNRLTYGPFTKKFENKFANMHDCKFAIMCSSGTSALRMAVHTLKEIHNWEPETEILIPAITFVATSNVVIQNGLKPVFVDVHPQYYNINPDKIEEKITKNTKAIIPVHLFGMPCEMDKITALAKKHNLKIIEDSCETVCAHFDNKKVGSFGDISCFSTYAAHLVVTGVGGVACTNNPDYAIKIRSLMNHGRDSIYLNIDDDQNKKDKELFKIVDKRFSFESIGYSDRITEMEAALGLAELEQLEENIRKRQTNAQFLHDQLKDLSEFIQLPTIHPKCSHSFMMFPIVVNEKVNRDDLIHFLEARQIETRGMLPLLNQPIYKKLFGDIENQHPAAQNINKKGFYIGCHPNLSQEDITYVARVFKEYFSQNTNLFI